VLRPAIEHAGGHLVAARSSQVHYRPGHDLVVRYRTEIDWGDGRPRRETIYLGTTRTGAPPGTIPVVASHAGTELAAGVWRWPFDPALPALERLARSAVDVLADHGLTDHGANPSTAVVAYRPTERAVLRIDTDDATWFTKLVRPSDARDLLRRHELLAAHGLPVPSVVAHDTEGGLVVMEALHGPTLRDLVKGDAPEWTSPDAVAELVRALRSVDTSDFTAARRRLDDGAHHVALLSTVLPEERARLARLDDRLQRARADAATRDRRFVHGDLHERQLVIGDGRVVGLIDVDECGLGDPIDDVAVPVAHLRHRALTAPNAGRIHRFADQLIDALREEIDPREAAIGSAAVLAGLATAPFRGQTSGWQLRVAAVLDLIDDQLGA
jgi:aminoglycoside phosphotransferase (APT) family kinase protein